MRPQQLLKFLLVPAALFAGSTMIHAQGVITTVAGNGTAGYSGDGGAAISASFDNIMGVCVDASENIYVADEYNNRVRKVAAGTGIVTTFAGTGTLSYTGMGGPAGAACIGYPDGLFADAHNNILITEWFNDRVTLVQSTTDNIIDMCGTSGSGDQGSGGDGGIATNSQMEIPSGSCMDAAGNLYIADYGNGRIQTVNAATHIVTTIASVPAINGIFFNNVDGHIYYCYNSAVMKMNPTTGVSTLVAGSITGSGYSGDGGPATAALLNSPRGLYIDAAGHYLYICDVSNNRVRRVSLASGIITTFAGNGIMGYSGDGLSSTHAELNGPSAVYGDRSGNIFIADNGNNRVRRVAASGAGLDPNTSGNNENYAGAAIAVYPNPSNGVFTLSGDLSGASYEVYNVTGQKITGNTCNTDVTTIDLSNQPTGIYMLSVKTPTGVQTEKLVIRN